MRRHPIKKENMTVRTAITGLVGLVSASLIALTLGACGFGGGKATTAAGPPKTGSGKPASLGVRTSNLGAILEDPKGRTLYLFKKDSGTRSACSGACAQFWPPLRANGRVAPGVGLTAGKLSTSPRSDGRPQVTYNGHPLYTYTGDHKPGDTNGQGLSAFGASWFALSAAGNQVSGTGSGGGVGY